MNKLILPSIIVIFILWILLQIALNMNIFKNPLNYCIAIVIFFLFLKFAKEK
ncbi:membrane protein [Bacillus glycinifermentans]|uniref:Uncharacterized protein n=1 Tax=Bacillus glycinifermentans TaxID=1664069 RepID=A0ABU6H3Q0_9BACI|nr:hypothetical protein [Bacillus glycinifermentans]ATH94178.1 hypothetical protein COP00_17485 [Bacillus glycinifermentans]KMM62820.1 membrane protein [Bacillus glycinifermentans]MEC0484522.1 hypothetical protein [Bacillus glycinifermentans]MEC0496913.1 hypothetical protein [Bacillus glycinifermentans]MEC0539582.1 hypothetical protein [Bacillus glycinifermentans]